MNSLATGTELSRLQRAGCQRHGIEAFARRPARKFTRQLALFCMLMCTLSVTGCYAYGGHTLESSELETLSYACEANARNDRRAYGTLAGRLNSPLVAGEELCGTAITVERTCVSDCDHAPE